MQFVCCTRLVDFQIFAALFLMQPCRHIIYIIICTHKHTMCRKVWCTELLLHVYLSRLHIMDSDVDVHFGRDSKLEQEKESLKLEAHANLD